MRVQGFKGSRVRVNGLKTEESILDPLNPRILEPSLNQRTH
jgi:hypothetical protein